jgi:hypothetical protein
MNLKEWLIYYKLLGVSNRTRITLSTRIRAHLPSPEIISGEDYQNFKEITPGLRGCVQTKN